jgi:hypothetical protein
MSENTKKLSIPLELFHPFFFSEKEISLDLSEQSSGNGENFSYELLFYNGIEANRPWTNPEQFVPTLQDIWGKVKPIIEEMHHQRKKDGIKEAMKKGIGLFLQFLYWSNGKPVFLKELPLFTNISIKPVNLEERVGFIISRPGLYHSYVQLCELMIEQEKLFAKNMMIKKASSRSNS